MSVESAAAPATENARLVAASCAYATTEVGPSYISMFLLALGGTLCQMCDPAQIADAYETVAQTLRSDPPPMPTKGTLQ